MRTRYILSGLCTLFFIAAQSFQEIAYRYWIPAAHNPQDELLVYLLPIDRVRSILIMSTIVLLAVPFVVIALRYFKVAPLASTLGAIFGAAFIGFELSHRSVDFFVIGETWARQLASASSTVERETVLQRFALWNQMVRGWYFPLMLSFLLASCSFAVATWNDTIRGRWYYLAPIAFVLNALRLLARILSTFVGQSWLAGFNDKLYFPAVLIINTLLLIWWFVLVREQEGTSSLEVS